MLAQLFATSLWFAPNAVMDALQAGWGISGGVGTVTTAVQLGFVSGTLCFAWLTLADRFHPGPLFLACAWAGALANLLVVWVHEHFHAVLAARFAVGFFLAGVYPVGMKMAAAWYGSGLGRALGFLVGALVLGTASAHLLRGLGAQADWRLVLFGTSALAAVAGVVAALLPEGPHLKRGGAVHWSDIWKAYRVRRFRSASLGYFGHMWEIYAFWAFMPVWLAAYGLSGTALSFTAFAVIGIGAVGCAGGGLWVRRLGGGRVALLQLGTSGLCCLVSPLMFGTPAWLFFPFLLLWGLSAAGDSPQFSALTARHAPPQAVGSALTFGNCAGFALSIGSLWLLEWLQPRLAPDYLLLALLPGPLLGVWAGRSLWWRDGAD